jgi:hypothetical protein
MKKLLAAIVISSNRIVGHVWQGVCRAVDLHV